MSKIDSLVIGAYLEELASKAPTPGGGAAAGVSGAQGAALMEMVCNLTKDQEGEISAIATRAGSARQAFLALAQRDMECFNAVMAAYRKPTSERDEHLGPALTEAAQVPLATIDECTRLIEPLERLAEIGNQNLVTDIGIAALLLEGAIRSSRLNVLIKLR
jgi:formiminotetrahydrofolate cyclodeaminase